MHTTRVALACILVATFFGTGVLRSNAQEQNGVDVRYETKKTGFTLHEPITVLFKVQNELPRRVTLDLGIEKTDSFEFSLTTPDGRVLQSSPLHSSGGFFPSGIVILEAGSTYEQALLLNQWFQFKTPGQYLLTSRLATKIDVSGGASLPSQTQATPLLIQVRDPALLERVCSQLASQVETAASVEAAGFPALELSYVEDPIAVSHLAHILSAHTLAYEKAIEGLERIGNDEAVEVLLSALDENYGGIADLATASLARVQNRILNPRLKETVKKAVERSTARAREEFIKTQIAYLDYRSPDLQRTAIQNLMQVQDGLQKAEPVLQRLANDPKQPADVRVSAKDALAKLHPNN